GQRQAWCGVGGRGRNQSRGPALRVDPLAPLVSRADHTTQLLDDAPTAGLEEVQGLAFVGVPQQRGYGVAQENKSQAYRQASSAEVAVRRFAPRAGCSASAPEVWFAWRLLHRSRVSMEPLMTRLLAGSLALLLLLDPAARAQDGGMNQTAALLA